MEQQTIDRPPVRSAKRKENWIVSGQQAPEWVHLGTFIAVMACFIALIVLISAVSGVKTSFNSWLQSQGATNNGATVLSLKPTNATWHKNAANYCTFVANYSNPAFLPPSQFGADILANAAPTTQSHNAAIQLWRDVSAHQANTAMTPTLTADVHAVQASYNCSTVTPTH